MKQGLGFIVLQVVYNRYAAWCCKRPAPGIQLPGVLSSEGSTDTMCKGPLVLPLSSAAAQYGIASTASKLLLDTIPLHTTLIELYTPEF